MTRDYDPLYPNDAFFYKQNQTYPNITLHSEPNTITISDLVSIGPDGTVTILKEGAESEAARVFWNCISNVFTMRITEAEEIMKALRSSIPIHYSPDTDKAQVLSNRQDYWAKQIDSYFQKYT